jgi:hypothetical protein
MTQAQPPQSFTGARLVPLDEIRDERLRVALAVWRETRCERKYPAKPQMTPRAMKPFLRNITLWRIAKNGTDYEYRIMGDADAAAYGRNMAGKHVSDLNLLKPGNGARVKAVLDYVVRKKEAIVSVGWLTASNENAVFHEMIFLPLGPDDATVDHILGVSVHSAG